MADTYKLVPEAVPGKSRGSLYTRIMAEFAVSKDTSVRVVTDRKPATVLLGLGKAKKADARYQGISVLRRGDAVYLKK